LNYYADLFGKIIAQSVSQNYLLNKSGSKKKPFILVIIKVV